MLTILFLISLHFSPKLPGSQNVLHGEGQPPRSCRGALSEEPPPGLLQTEAVREGLRGVVVEALVERLRVPDALVLAQDDAVAAHPRVVYI